MSWRKTFKATLVIIVVMAVFMGIPEFAGTNWLYLISWLPAIMIGAYLDNEIDDH